MNETLPPKPVVGLDCNEARLTRDLIALLESGFEVVHVERCVAPPSVLVIGASSLSAPEVRERIRSRRREWSPTPILLATSWRSENLVLLRDLLVDEVWGIEDAPARLVVSIRDLLRRDQIEALAAQVEEVGSRDPVVRAFVLRALRAHPTFRTVERLALEAGVSRATLYRRWGERGPSELAHPGAFLQHLALARWSKLVAEGKSTSQAATSVGWSLRSLDRAARACYGCSLPELSSRSRELLVSLSALVRSMTG